MTTTSLPMTDLRTTNIECRILYRASRTLSMGDVWVHTFDTSRVIGSMLKRLVDEDP